MSFAQVTCVFNYCTANYYKSSWIESVNCLNRLPIVIRVKHDRQTKIKKNKKVKNAFWLTDYWIKPILFYHMTCCYDNEI